jgi:hypothetical protein
MLPKVTATSAFFCASDGKVLSSGVPVVRKREMSSSADSSSIGPTEGARAKIGWAAREAVMIAPILSGASGRCSAWVAGARPIKISMIRPMPFWPSFEPCAKLTPVQVSSRTERIRQGGGALPLGARWRSRLRIRSRARASTAAAPMKPIIGEVTRANTVSSTLPQFTPSPKPWPAISEFIRPIEPIKVCELDAGRPRYQVPTFQMMADSSSAMTMANAASLRTSRMSSIGRSATMAKATAPDDTTTPKKFQSPDHTTAWPGMSALV